MEKSFYWIVLSVLMFSGCGEDNKSVEEINKIEVDLRVARFDNEFGNAQPADIPKLRKEYPYLFPAPDSIWVAKLQDSLQIELRTEVKREFTGFKEAEDIELLFKHMKYYFPKFKAPKVITVTNNVDYNNRVILADSLLLIGLDNYLGPDHRYYSGMQNYIAAGMNRDFMVSNIASAFANKLVSGPKDRSFLSRIVYAGKVLYLKDILMPFQADNKKIAYTEDQLEWAQTNEEPIWRHFIERELLYSTDNKLSQRFLDSAPFSKFGLEQIDGESPGRIGRYMGWQIVRSFMERNDVSIQHLMGLPAEEIFKKANYKPNK